VADASAVKARLLRRAQAAQLAAARETAEQAQRSAPVDTGQLRRSVTVGPQTTTGGRIATQVSVKPQRSPSSPDNLDVARFTEGGTRPHVIRPKRRGGVLRWTSGGQVHFARSVQNPGTTARPWFYPALRRWQVNIRSALRR
jgi:hypothetical protein